MGVIPRAFNLIPVPSAEENVELPLLVTGTPPEEAREHARATLSRVGLADRGSQRPAGLSGGQAQRFSIVAALVNDPEVVFLDEPTTGLAPQARRNLWDLVRTIGEELPITPRVRAMRAVSLQGAGPGDIPTELAGLGRWVPGSLLSARLAFGWRPRAAHDGEGGGSGEPQVHLRIGSSPLRMELSAAPGALHRVPASRDRSPEMVSLRTGKRSPRPPVTVDDEGGHSSRVTR